MRFGFILFFIIAIIGCSPAPTRVNLAGNSWLGYEPLFISYERAQREQVPLLFDLHRLPSTSNVLRLMAEGWLDGGLLTIDEALTYQAQTGEPLCVLLVTNVSLGGDAVVMTPQWQALQRPLKIAHEPTAVGRYMLERAQQRNAFAGRNIEAVLASVNKHKVLYENQEVDGVVTFYPSLKEIKELGGSVIFDSTDIPNEIIDVVAIKQHAWQQGGKALQTQIIALWNGIIGEFSEFSPAVLHSLSQHSGLNEMQLKLALNGISLSGAYLSSQFELTEAVTNVNQHLLTNNIISTQRSLEFCQAKE